MGDSDFGLVAAYSLVAVAPDPDTTGLSLGVTTGTGVDFPAPPFFAQLWPADEAPVSDNAEIVKVTVVDVDTFTIARHQYGTSAQPVAIGFQVQVVSPNHPGNIVASVWNASQYGEPTPIVGAATGFLASVTDVNGDAVNPDTLSVTFRAQGQPAVGPFTFTEPSGDPDGVVLYVDTGSFRADYLLPNAGLWTYQWNAQPSSGLDITATSAITEGDVLLSQSGV